MPNWLLIVFTTRTKRYVRFDCEEMDLSCISILTDQILFNDNSYIVFIIRYLLDVVRDLGGR